MKKFWLFSGPWYYPDAGLGDYRGAFDTLEEAKAATVDVDEGRWAVVVTVNSEGDLEEVWWHEC